MTQNKNNLSQNKAWELLLEKYNIIEKIKKNGYFQIRADQIKEYKEPRLMAKWDSSDSLPKILKDNKINILPTSRGSYILGDFILYQDIPELKERITQMTHVDIPKYESIDINHISSEANAINVLIISGILDDFLQERDNISTFNGRMCVGKFDFTVKTFRNIPRTIHVNGAQCEIDGGFENNNSVIIMEAKNVIHKDFHIRQLYFPYRLWITKVKKPIRLIFMIYSNKIYRLFEYKFKTVNDFSSIELVNMKNYSLQDIKISIDDLIFIKNNTNVITDDNMRKSDIPFIQANSMDRIISLLENMYENPLTLEQIAELMDFEPRQSSYYFNAGRYLGLFEKETIDHQVVHFLTPLGKQIFKLDYKPRQLELVKLILKHQIFADFFDFIIETGEFPEINNIMEKMKQYNVCNDGQIKRRASSVLGWLKWIFNLPKLSGY